MTFRLTVNEAACVTGVPLKQVHRIIDAGLLGYTADGTGSPRTIRYGELVGLRFAYEMADLITLEGRRRLVSYLFKHPRAKTAWQRNLSVDIRSMRKEIRIGLTQLSRARNAVQCDERVMSGTPCFKGTRIPVYDIAEMLTNGDSPIAICEAFPRLSREQIDLAAIYSRAYPRRGRPRRRPFWHARKPIMTTSMTLAFANPKQTN